MFWGEKNEQGANPRRHRYIHSQCIRLTQDQTSESEKQIHIHWVLFLDFYSFLLNS